MPIDVRELLPEGMRDSPEGSELIEFIRVRLENLGEEERTKVLAVLPLKLEPIFQSYVGDSTPIVQLTIERFDMDAHIAYTDKKPQTGNPFHGIYEESHRKFPRRDDRSRPAYRREEMSRVLEQMEPEKREKLFRSVRENEGAHLLKHVKDCIGIVMKELISDTHVPAQDRGEEHPGGPGTSRFRRVVEVGERPRGVDTQSRINAGLPRETEPKRGPRKRRR